MKKLFLTLALALGLATAQGQNDQIPTFAPGKESIEVAFFADIHVNEGNAMERAMRQAVEEVNSLPYDFVVIAGDLCNMGSDAELEVVHEIVSKFNKPLMVTAGNHENRIYRTDGIDITRLVCRELCIEDKYHPAGVLVFLRFGERSSNT